MQCPICSVDLSNMKGRVVFCPSCGNEIGSKLENQQTNIPSNTIPVRNPASAQAEIPFDQSLNPTNNFTKAPPPTQFSPQPMHGQYGNRGVMPGQFDHRGVMPGTGQPFQIVGFGLRFVAYIIDWIILSFLSDWITSGLFPGIVSQVNADLDAMLNSMLETNATEIPSFGSSYYYLLIINFVIALIYYFLSYLGLKGRTAGKAICGLRAVDEQTMQPLTNPGRVLIDVVTKAAGSIVLLLDVIIGAISQPGYQHKVRVTQKISKSIIIKQNRY